MSSVSSTSSAPLFTIKNPNQLLLDPSDRSERVLEMSVYHSHQVILKTSTGRELTIKPRGFNKNDYCDDKSFLQDKHAWQVKQSADTFVVDAIFRILGGGNDSSTLKAKSLSNTTKQVFVPNKVGTTNNDGPVKLTKAEEKLLIQHIKFPPEHYKDRYGAALANACELSSSKSEIQTQILKILLLKLKIRPDKYAANELLNHTPINEDAVEVFLQARLNYNQLSLQRIVGHKNFNLYQRVLDNEPDLNQSTVEFFPASSFFSKIDVKDIFISHNVPFFYAIIVDKSCPNEFFTYFKKTQPVDQKMINKKIAFGRNLLMSMLNDPELYDDRLKWILTFNPEMHIIDAKGRTALFYLLMSVDSSTFEKYLDLLIQHGLNLNQAISEKDTQFSQCLNLLVDLDVKNKDMQILNVTQKPDLLQKIDYMIKKGADCSGVSLETFLSLPTSLQNMIEASISGQARPVPLENSESADTSSGTPPKEPTVPTFRSTSPTTTVLDLFLDQFPSHLTQLINRDVFLNTLENAFRASKLSLVFSEINTSWQKSLFDYLYEKLRNAIENGAHTRRTFEAGITVWLNQWKGARQQDILARQAAIHQNQALEQKEDKLNQLADEADRKKQEAEEAQKKAKAEQSALDAKNQAWQHHENFRYNMGWTK